MAQYYKMWIIFALLRIAVREVAFAGRKPEDPIQAHVVEDWEKGHFLAFVDGYQGQRRTYGMFLHVDVMPNGKVYIRHDGTEVVIAERLAERGIPKSDIILMFQPPIHREDTAYALG